MGKVSMRRYKKEKAAFEWLMASVDATHASVQRTIKSVDRTIAMLDKSNDEYWKKKKEDDEEEKWRIEIFERTYNVND
jgi:hypothetical protein